MRDILHGGRSEVEEEGAARSATSQLFGSGLADVQPVSSSADLPATPRLASHGFFASAGQPLERPVRERFEEPLGLRLDAVRVHTGAVETRPMGAHAITFGSDIGFAPGRYAPGTAAGDALIGHELSHVVQQAHAGPPRLRAFIPDPVAEPLRRLAAYAHLFQLIADEQAATANYGYRSRLPALYKMRTLALALIQGDGKGAQTVIAELLKDQTLGYFTTGEEENMSGIVMELIAGTYLLGLRKEAGQLKDFFIAEGRSFAGTRKQPERELWVFEGIVETAIGRVRLGSPAKALASIELLAETFRGLSADLGRKYQGPPHDAPDQALYNLVEHALRAYQVVAQGVIGDFQVGAAAAEPKSVQAARDVLDRMDRAFGPYYADTPLRMDSTPLEESPKPRHLDAFDPDRGPSIPITSYSYEQPELKNKSLRLSRILEIRRDQLEMLSWLHGHGKDPKTQAPDPVSQRNAEAMKSNALKLHDNESWRTFVMARFEAAKRAGKSDHEALSETVDTIRRYLRVFTIHTPNNIDDFGDLTLAAARKQNYLEREFPRALTGQLIHDCGVYALRVAYALSLVRDKLNLRVRAILLPAHIGLIISFEKFDSGPVFFVHNDLIREVSAKDLKEMQTDWTAAGNVFDEAKFLAAVSGSFFMAGVDMPYRLEDVPSLPQKTEKERRAALWEFYLQKAAPRAAPKVPDVLKPIPGDKEPWMLYLQVTTLQRDAVNEGEIPFWKEARKYADITDVGKWLTEAKKTKRYDQAVVPIWKQYWTMSQEWRTGLVALAEARAATGDFLKQNPGALGERASIIQSAIVFTTPGKYESLLWDYLGEPATLDERKERNADTALKRAQQSKAGWLLEGGTYFDPPPWIVVKPPDPMD